MGTSLLDAAFAHHVWATSRLIDVCLALSEEELQTNVLGTRGPILETLRHIVGGDCEYLYILSGDSRFDIDGTQMSLMEARLAMERNAPAWAQVVSQALDPDAMVQEVDKTDGYKRLAPVGFRIAQALHHGSDHRSQVCTALTTLGIHPPAIDVWDFGVYVQRIRETMPEA